jgi:hypothetical protein
MYNVGCNNACSSDSSVQYYSVLNYWGFDGDGVGPQVKYSRQLGMRTWAEVSILTVRLALTANLLQFTEGGTAVLSYRLKEIDETKSNN